MVDQSKQSKQASNRASRALCLVFAAALALLSAACWLLPKDDYSESERRNLRAMPSLTLDSVLEGRFMDQFEAYAQDAFPFREPFRQAQALANLGFGRLDGNGLYLAAPQGGLPFEDAYVCALDYQLDEGALARVLGRFAKVNESYLEGSGARVFAAVIPDKAYYLAGQSGHPSLDYEALFAMVEGGMPFAEHIDLTGSLGVECFYRTDTHWRQEALVPLAGLLLERMAQAEAQPDSPARGQREAGKEAFASGFAQQGLDFEQRVFGEPFCGVYLGQSALPLAPDTLIWLENDLTRAARAYDFEHGREIPLYDEAFAYANPLDPYELFLGGPLSLVSVENPLAQTDRELVIFRDSFGSALAPLLLEPYAKITLVDLRYIQPEALEGLVSFEGADVLFLHSTLSLNAGV